MNSSEITLNDLPRRQREVVCLLVSGIGTSQGLAEAMGVSKRTVNSHLLAIFNKLDLVLSRRNKIALMGWGMRQLQEGDSDE